MCNKELYTLYHDQGCSMEIGGDGVCFKELDTLYHDQGCSMEVMECVLRN